MNIDNLPSSLFYYSSHVTYKFGVRKFKYLRSVITEDGKYGAEIRRPKGDSERCLKNEFC